MTPWTWWVGNRSSVEEDGVFDINECSTREGAVQSGLRETSPGEQFYVMEARCCTATRYWRDEYWPQPFLRTRYRELLTNSPTTKATGLAEQGESHDPA